MPLARVLLALSAGLCLYTYFGYPVLLKLLSLARRPRPVGDPPSQWPRISIVLPVYNEAGVIAGTLERLLALDYPNALRQILVVSDASTDGTDEIVSRFAGRGVDLLRLPRRQGKTAAENAARRHLTGEIIINTDASVRIDPAAVKPLVAAFGDPSVGVASARDVSVTSLDEPVNVGEEAYVGYEMWTRDAETAVYGIVGASGCLYAIRAGLHMGHVPEDLSRDFAAALTAREHGFRAVSAPAARWLVPCAALVLLGTLGALALTSWWALGLLVALGAVGGLAGIAWVWPESEPLPRLLGFPAYVALGNVAVLHAWLRVLAGRPAPVWEPTRRGAAT